MSIVKCLTCSKEFTRSPSQQRKSLSKNQFCSKNCFATHRDQTKLVECPSCGKTITKKRKELNKSKSGKTFCNLSCSASFHNTQKRKTRRSKMETRLFELIKTDFPNLLMLANDKTLLDGLEVDIAFPTIKLAIEWNGVVHYKPIFGTKKLQSIQNNDHKKELLATKKKINLIVIPDLVSNEKILHEAYSKIKPIIISLETKTS